MRIRFTSLNFENECMWDCISGNGFLISEMPFSDVDKTIRNINGPRSPRYGTTYGDTNEFMDRYRCECGELVGAAFEGEICPKCHKAVEYTDVNIPYTGWLNFSPYKIIAPRQFMRLQSALGRKTLEDIIGSENIITASGIIRRHDEEVKVKKRSAMSMKYYNIGIWAFYQHYEEIMAYHMSRHKQKAAQIQQLIDEKSYVWTSKLPVYTTALRQQGITAESFYFQASDREINPLTAITINLKKANSIEVPLYLYQAQQRANKLWDITFQLINTKHGWIRANVLGGEFNYSGRAVIVLDPTLKIDELDMPYKMFIEQYKQLIIRRIMREKGWMITKTTNYLASKFEYDPYVYRVMCDIIREETPACILSRNPEKLGVLS